MRRLRAGSSYPRAEFDGGTSEVGPQITASHKENPMSLGVLNTLSAVYAENYLTRAFLI